MCLQGGTVAGVTPLDPDWQVTVLPNKFSPLISRQSRNHAFNLLERKQMRIPIACAVWTRMCHSLSNRFKRQLSTTWLNIPVPWQAMATSHLCISSLGEPDSYGSPEWVSRLATDLAHRRGYHVTPFTCGLSLASVPRRAGVTLLHTFRYLGM